MKYLNNIYFRDQSCIFSIIAPVFSVTWSSEIIIICCFAAESPVIRWGVSHLYRGAQVCGGSLLLAGGEFADLAGGGDAFPGGIGGRAGAPLGFGLQRGRLGPVHTPRFGHGTGALRSSLFFLIIIILIILRDLPCSNPHHWSVSEQLTLA